VLSGGRPIPLIGEAMYPVKRELPQDPCLSPAPVQAAVFAFGMASAEQTTLKNDKWHRCQPNLRKPANNWVFVETLPEIFNGFLQALWAPFCSVKRPFR